jgi:hypothetical protein
MSVLKKLLQLKTLVESWGENWRIESIMFSYKERKQFLAKKCRLKNKIKFNCLTKNIIFSLEIEVI